MAEFHIGDPVRNTITGDAFVVTGIMLSSTIGLMYCGERIGWTAEEDLDHDFSPEVKTKLAPVDAELHVLRVSVMALKDELTKLRTCFNGELPAYIKEDILELITCLSVIHK